MRQWKTDLSWFTCRGVFRSGNDESLAAVIDGVMEKLQATEGIKDVQVNDVTGESGVKVEINYEQQTNGLNIMSIGSTIRTAFSGQVVGDITLNDKDIDIFVRLDENRTELKDLEICE